MNLKNQVREVPNWPISGVNFKDITPILQSPPAFRYLINKLCLPYKKIKVDKVIAIDARGFLIATPMAYLLRAGVCLVRKKGKLPRATIETTYQKEYGPDILAMHRDSVQSGEKVVIVDDVLATGGTLSAAANLVSKLGGQIIGISVIIDLPFLGGRKLLNQYSVHSLISYENG
ncbi:MAG: adenine phosphoribosyltransferase [Candidatus Shapirobacteria bacterium]